MKIRIAHVVLGLGLLAGCVACDKTAARTATAKADIAQLVSALEEFRAVFGVCPTTQQGLSALVQAPAGLKGWRGPYYAYPHTIPLDPWGHNYVYRNPGTRGAAYDLFSLGPDGIEGTADDVH
jgi:general secretion pathway protein G